jgi:anti-sigma regulatory factor (Ser/Thr protein kinase)
MVSTKDAATLSQTSRGEWMTVALVTLVLPREGYERVARLVAAGVASRLGFGYETVDDVQLAIELVLHAVTGENEAVTLRFCTDGTEFTIEIGGIDELSLEQPLNPLDGAGVGLGASLARLVDSVEARESPEASVVLAKTLPSPAS